MHRHRETWGHPASRARLVEVFWAALTALISSGIGFIGDAPAEAASPQTARLFSLPMASASLRLHCAQVAANKQTVDDLLEAIALVQALPSNHRCVQKLTDFWEWSLGKFWNWLTRSSKRVATRGDCHW